MLGDKTFRFDVGQWINFHDEVIFQEEEAHNGEEVDKDEGQEGCQQDGASIASHTFDDIK